MKVHSRKWRLSSQTRLKKLEKFDEDNLPRAVLPGDIKDVLGWMVYLTLLGQLDTGIAYLMQIHLR